MNPPSNASEVYQASLLISGETGHPRFFFLTETAPTRIIGLSFYPHCPLCGIADAFFFRCATPSGGLTRSLLAGRSRAWSNRERAEFHTYTVSPGSRWKNRIVKYLRRRGKRVLPKHSNPRTDLRNFYSAAHIHIAC